MPREGTVSGFVKRGIAVFVVALIAAFAAFALSFLMPLRYRSTSTFHPERLAQSNSALSMPNFIGISSMDMLAQGTPPEYIVRLIRSHSLLEQLVRTPFIPESLIQYYGVEERKDSIQFAIKHFRDDLHLSIDRAPGIIRMDVDSKDPNLGWRVATRIIELTGKMNSELMQSSNREKEEFLQTRLVESSQSLHEVEDSLRAFLKSNRRLDSPDLQFERRRLERYLAIEQELYLMLAREAKSVEIEAVNDLPRITIIDSPILPMRPSSPRRFFIAFIAFLVVGVLTSFYYFGSMIRFQ
jgi:uncharacterized protein involved in exopolysaccharide biosynthesis